MRLALALLLGAGAATAEEGLRCAPDHPVLCASIHVSCAGRSRIPAPPFTVRFSGQRAAVDFAGGEVWDAGVSRSQAGIVLRPEAGRDWVRLAPDGRFSLRRHGKGGALMAAGMRVPADGGRRFQRNVGARSRRSWARIPDDAGHGFQLIVGARMMGAPRPTV